MKNPSTVWKLEPLAPGNGELTLNCHGSHLISTIRDECYVFCGWNIPNLRINMPGKDIQVLTLPSRPSYSRVHTIPESIGISIITMRLECPRLYQLERPHVTWRHWSDASVVGASPPKMIRNFRSVKCINGELYGDNLILHNVFFFFFKP